jgi:aminopeptidase N
MWIQEGICSFGDALATKELAGEEAYFCECEIQLQHLRKNSRSTRRTSRFRQCYKGTHSMAKELSFMHSLSYLLGEQVFFPILKKLATDEKYTYNHFVTTDDVEQLFSKESGKNLKPFFDFYLRTN